MSDEERESSRGTICLCGLAKSYHGRGPGALADHEYQPRYPARRAAPEDGLKVARRVADVLVSEGLIAPDLFDYAIRDKAIAARLRLAARVKS